jgi:hypothetical protein
MDFTYWWKYGELSKENNKYYGKSKTNPPLVASISTDGTRTLAKLLNLTRIAGNLEMTILILKLYSMVSTYVSYTKDVENWPTLSQINSHKYELASNLLEVEKFKSVKKTSIMANLIRPSWLSGLFLCQVVNKEKDLQFKDDEDKAVNNLSNTQLENIWQRILPQPELTLANLRRLDVSLYLCMTSKIVSLVYMTLFEWLLLKIGDLIDQFFTFHELWEIKSILIVLFYLNNGESALLWINFITFKLLFQG